MKCFALRLVLKQMQKGTRKWSIDMLPDKIYKSIALRKILIFGSETTKHPSLLDLLTFKLNAKHGSLGFQMKNKTTRNIVLI